MMRLSEILLQGTSQAEYIDHMCFTCTVYKLFYLLFRR